MKAVFDARWIYDKPSGIGVYAREMMNRLPGLLPQWHFNFLFCSEALRDRHMNGLGGHGNVDAVVVPYGPLSPKGQFFMPAELRKLDARLFHTPNYMMPYLAFPRRTARHTKCIVNIHDVIPLVVEDYAPNSRTSRFKGVFRTCMKQSVLRADCVITGSEVSRRDLVSSLSLDEANAAKIHVIFDGAGGASGSAEHAPIQTDETTPRTLLYVGRMDPYKNVTGLVEALALARKRLNFPLKLVVCGPLDDRYPEAREMAARLGVSEDVRFSGFVSDEELMALYRTSDLLTHPSRYEGFGLQIVEAMRSGLPVCCTDGGSQPEIAGDAACVVKAGDSLAMANAITELLTSPATLQKMKSAGIERAKLFDWGICAEKTAELYRTVVGASPSH